MIIDFESLEGIRDQHPTDRIVFAGGVFDLMHPGHLDLFRHMREAGELTVVAVSTDRRVRERKGHTRPIHDALTRLAMVDAIRYVDLSLIAPEAIPETDVPTLRMIQALKPDIFMSSDESWLKFEDKVNRHGTELVVIPRFSEIVSTSQTIDRILEVHSIPT